MTNNFYEAVKNRRTTYAIGKEKVVSEDRIQEVVAEAVKHSPSAFNSQSGRAIILFNDAHENLWDITTESLRAIVPAEYFPDTLARINSFKNGYGTVLFFEDQEVVEGLQAQFADYKDNFPLWSQQSSGMLQYIVWTSLELEGVGASLQHYGGLIEGQVAEKWDIPSNWKLISQMPFGNKVAEPDEKQFAPLNDRFRVYTN